VTLHSNMTKPMVNEGEDLQHIIEKRAVNYTEISFVEPEDQGSRHKLGRANRKPLGLVLHGDEGSVKLTR
jgi:hypothetical protein